LCAHPSLAEGKVRGAMFDKERLKVMLAESLVVFEIIKAVVFKILYDLFMLETDNFLNLYRDECLEDGTRRFVRNGYKSIIEEVRGKVSKPPPAHTSNLPVNGYEFFSKNSI
jgi:hypothetical protein